MDVLLLVLPIYVTGIVSARYLFGYFACRNFSIENCGEIGKLSGYFACKDFLIENCGEIGKLSNLPWLLINKIDAEAYQFWYQSHCFCYGW